MSSPKTLFAALTTVAAMGLSTGVHAQLLPAGYETISVKVRFADLDMAGDPGASAALARVRQAAEVVCGEAAGHWDLGYRARRTTCMSSTVERTVAELASPRVTALLGAGPGLVQTASRGR